MKNTLCVGKVYYCYNCKIKGFFCYTPNGADFETCPSCGKYDYLNSSVNDVTTPTKYDFLSEDEYANDMRNLYSYCEHCKIIFKLGCMHYNGGCTDNTYNCHFIKRWKDKINNIEYEGMPMFDDNEDWFNNVNNVEILQMYCPHHNDKCKKNKSKINGECNL